MVNKSKMLTAAVLASLMAIPGMANANYGLIAPYKVDGTAVEEAVQEIASDKVNIGDKGKVITFGAFGLDTHAYSILSSAEGGKPTTVTVNGSQVHSYAVKAQEGSTINIGDSDTDTVTIDGATFKAGENTGLTVIKGSHVTINAKTIDISTKAEGDEAAIEVQNSTQKETAPEGASSLTLKGDTINITSPNWGLSRPGSI